jgi:ANTAR domain
MSEENPDFDEIVKNEQQRFNDAIQAFAESRSVIEQTKGMLMFIYGVDADEAFEMLRWQSQNHNIKLRLLAEEVMKELLELSKSEPFGRRLAADGVLLTVHQRIAEVAARQTNGHSKTGGISLYQAWVAQPPERP